MKKFKKLREGMSKKSQLAAQRKTKELIERIEQLEARIRVLEARPINYPNVQPYNPYYPPSIHNPPTIPQLDPILNPNMPPWELWKVTC